MPEEIEAKPEEEQITSDGGRLNPPVVDEAMTPPRWRENKWKILGGILGILVFAGAVFGAYKFGQRQIPFEPTPTPLPSEAPAKEGDPTADWKTYKNEALGFQFKYPSDPKWNIKKGVQGTSSLALYNYDIDKAPGRDYIPSVDGDLFKVEITVNDKYSDVNEWFIEEKQKTDSDTDEQYEFLNVKSITVDSQKGIYYELKSMSGLNIGLAVFESPKKQLIHFYSGLNFEGNQQTFNLILSTFKFLEEGTPSPTPSAKIINYQVIDDWARYDNVSGDYSIQYNPAEYKIVDEDITNPTYSIIDELTLSCITPNCQTGTWIRIYSNYDGSSLRSWLEEFRNISRTERYLEDIIVKNVKALIAMDDRITEVAIPSNDKVISVEIKGPFYNVTQKKPINIEFVYQFLSTFKFLD